MENEKSDKKSRQNTKTSTNGNTRQYGSKEATLRAKCRKVGQGQKIPAKQKHLNGITAQIDENSPQYVHTIEIGAKQTNNQSGAATMEAERRKAEQKSGGSEAHRGAEGGEEGAQQKER